MIASEFAHDAGAGGFAYFSCAVVGVILAAMVVLLATGAVPPRSPDCAGLLAAGAIVVGRVLTIERAYRGISWATVVLVAGIPLSTAMTDTGASAKLADVLVDIVGGSGPYASCSASSC